MCKVFFVHRSFRTLMKCEGETVPDTNQYVLKACPLFIHRYIYSSTDCVV